VVGRARREDPQPKFWPTTNTEALLVHLLVERMLGFCLLGVLEACSPLVLEGDALKSGAG